MALVSTQPLTEMSTWSISWGVKETGAQGWQPYHLHVSIVLKSVSVNFLEPSGPVQACNGIALPLLLWELHKYPASVSYQFAVFAVKLLVMPRILIELKMIFEC